MKRRYRRRKRPYYGKNNTWGRFNYVAKTSANALRLAKRVKSLINVEYKTHDFTSSGTNITSSGTILYLTGVDQGDDDETRDGNTIKLTRLLGRAKVTQHASATTSTVRIILFKDKSSSGSTPTVAQVLKSATPISPLNLDYRKRFVILSDKLFTFDSIRGRIRTIKWFKKMQNQIVYSGSGTTTASLMSNGLFMLIISDEGTNYPVIGYDIRLRFLDN